MSWGNKQSCLLRCINVYANIHADKQLKLIAVINIRQLRGICSLCGTLLHGNPSDRSALSNKEVAPPIDRDGNILLRSDGAPQTDAQPPFLLRYSPALFAKEAPAMFQHDMETNRLSLVGGRREPWLRQHHPNQLNKADTWLYCRDCHDRYFDNGKKPRGHLPFRDKVCPLR